MRRKASLHACTLVALALALASAGACGRRGGAESQERSRAISAEDAGAEADAKADAHANADADADAKADESADGGRLGAERSKIFATHAGDDAWVKGLPRAATFKTLDLSSGVDPAATLEIFWRVYPAHTLRKLPPQEDYGGNHPSPLELVLTRGSVVRRLALDEYGGGPASTSCTTCKRQGYKLPPDDNWAFPDLGNLVSAFSMETIQGSTDFVLLLGRNLLRVLHRNTHDGACPVSINQGPLRSCVEMKWQLFADVKLAGEPPAREAVLDLDNAGNATVFDCKRSYSGSRLVDP